jgi:hypothetical protein
LQRVYFDATVMQGETWNGTEVQENNENREQRFLPFTSYSRQINT